MGIREPLAAAGIKGGLKVRRASSSHLPSWCVSKPSALSAWGSSDMERGTPVGSESWITAS